MGCFMAQLDIVLGPFLWLFYGWLVGSFMDQLRTVLGPFCDCFIAGLCAI